MKSLGIIQRSGPHPLPNEGGDHDPSNIRTGVEFEVKNTLKISVDGRICFHHLWKYFPPKKKYTNYQIVFFFFLCFLVEYAESGALDCVPLKSLKKHTVPPPFQSLGTFSFSVAVWDLDLDVAHNFNLNNGGRCQDVSWDKI